MGGAAHCSCSDLPVALCSVNLGAAGGTQPSSSILSEETASQKQQTDSGVGEGTSFSEAPTDGTVSWEDSDAANSAASSPPETANENKHL